MTIKELCNKSYCATCVFYFICVWNDKNPKQWDKLTNKIISDAIINTARRLQEDRE